MCISTVIQHNRSQCLTNSNLTNLTLYYGSIKEVNKEWAIPELNCSLDFVSIVIRELDISNCVREMRFNVTRGIDIKNINESEFNFPNTLWYILPAWEVATKSAAVAPLAIIGVLLNSLLLTLLARRPRLHTPTNLLVASMALADMATLLFCPWMLLVNHFYQNYMMGTVGCKVEGFLSGALLITSVMNLSVISYDRLTAIVAPQEARLTRRAALHLAMVSWLIGIIFALPLFIWRHYRERQWLNFLEKYCTEDYKILPVYWHVLIFILVWFPLCVMTICYSAIFWKLDRYQQQILRREHPLTVTYKTRVARTIFIVVVTFIICRVPFTVLVFWRNKMLKEGKINSVDKSFHILWFIAHYLIFLNCAINPIIYGLTNENYKKAFRSTPLYKWFSKMHCKEIDKAKKKTEKTPKHLQEKKTESKDSKRYCFWMNVGKITFPEGEKVENSSEVKDKLDSPRFPSSKITPLPDDYM